MHVLRREVEALSERGYQRGVRRQVREGRVAAEKDPVLYPVRIEHEESGCSGE